jgi:hypothetical protein
MNRLLYIALLILTGACKGFFGEKTDLSFIDKPVFTEREQAYVPIQPVLQGYVDPVNVIAGFDRLFYVIDRGTSQIISYDLSGRELRRLTVPGLVNAAMDREFDLLAIGRYDTVQGDQTLRLACVYRIKQSLGSMHGLQYATMKPSIIHPYYKGIKSAVVSDQDVDFGNIGVLADNTWYVTRSGPRNNSDQFGGPDEAILQVRPDLLTFEKDKFVGPININTGQGIYNDYFKQPVGLCTFVQPPQDPRLSSSRDFLSTSVSKGTSLKVQYIEYKEDDGGGSFSIKFLASGDTTKADGFLYEPDKFSQPVAITVAGDRTSYIFVADAGKDSVFQFTKEGLEGVNPTLASGSKKQVQVSFGGRGTGLTQFNRPSGVAYLDQILYVADRGNRRVLRFKLTGDFD